MLKIVFALIFIGLAWAAVTVFGLPTWWAWLATGVVAGAVVLRVGLAWFLARRAAGKLESALASPGDAAGLRPELQRQIEGMRAEFLRALSKLKASRLGASGRNALAALPWYVIIGPPGSGKSTVLRNSGLRFPYLSAKKGSVRGVGGTRNCDWWLANEAILLDTAGRWTTEDDDQEEWLAFLELLRRTRKGRPLNGILVSVGAGDLLESTPEATTELAQKLRERVDEVMKRLQVTLPVYLLVTKCDLISGFVEAFGGVAEKQRGQVWGVTLPLDADPGERPQMFAERLDRLVDALEQRMLGRMRAEPRTEERHRLYEFSQQFEVLCPNLVDLVNDLFAENNYEETPILRGVYFTSATQEGRPIDRVVKDIAERIGIAPVVDYQPVLKTRSYFLKDVFLQVVFPDRKVAGLTQRAMRRARLLGMGGAAAAFAAAAGIALMPVAAYSRNRALAKDVRQYVETLAASRSRAAGAPAMPSARLDDLYERSSELLRLRKEGPPVGMTFGFYQGDNVAPLLGRATRDHVASAILAADVGSFSPRSTAGRAEGRFKEAVQALRLHLLLTAEKAPSEPDPESDDWREAVAEARELGALRWRAHLRAEGGRETPRSSAVVGDAIEIYLHEAAREPLLWEPRNQGFVDKTRDLLCRLLRKDPLDQIVGDPALDQFQVALNEVVGGSITLFQDDARVRGAYTRDGWRVVKAELDAKLGGKKGGGADSQDWLLGGCEALSPEEVAGLRRDYLDRYDKEWSSFLTRVYPREPKDLGEGKDLLRRYAEERPLASVWRAVAENVPLEPPPEEPGALEKGLAKAKGKGASWLKRGLDRFRERGADEPGGPEQLERELEGLDRRFAPFLAFGISVKDGVPSMLETYFERLLAVVGAIEAYEDNKDAQSLRQDVLRLNREIDALVSRSGAQDWQSVIRKMLLTPFSGLDIVVGQNLNVSANRRFCDAVVVPFDLTLADRYPFRPDGPDAPLSAVEQFFHPESGVLWAYFKDALAGDLEPISFKPKPGTPVRYRAQLTSYLQRARQATDLLFPRGASGISVPLQVRIWPPGSSVKKVVFSLGGRAIEHGNWAESFQPHEWPARGAVLQVYGDTLWQLPEPGDWGLFRLLGRARTKRRLDQDEYLEAIWEKVAPGVSLRIDFKPAPLLSILHRLDPPRAVAAGGGCAN